ncbi:MAG: aspartyl protease family protein [Pseudobdellovibrionaceae bacterium]
MTKKPVTTLPERKTGSAVRSLAEAEIANGYDIQKFHLTSRTGNTPGVLANIAIKGKSYQFLVDTGASGHFIHEDLVKDLQIKQLGGSQGSTPYGDFQTTLLENIDVVIDHTLMPLTDSITVFNEAPNGLKEAGIYGLLSPPKLAVGALVILDHFEPALYLVRPVPADPLKWLQQAYPDIIMEEVNRVIDPNPYRELIGVKSDIFGDLTMTLDSGATTTIIYSDKVVDPKKGISLKIGNFGCRTHRAQVRSIHSPGHGNHLLGMDCLSDKILAFAPMGTQHLWIGWIKR